MRTIPDRQKKLTIQDPVALEVFICDLLDTVSDADTDEDVARLYADWCWLHTFGFCYGRQRARRIHLTIMCERGPRRRILPPSIPYEWQQGGVFGISTADYERARDWTVTAMLAGYSVTRSRNKRWGGFGRGTIDEIRKRARERMS